MTTPGGTGTSPGDEPTVEVPLTELVKTVTAAATEAATEANMKLLEAAGFRRGRGGKLIPPKPQLTKGSDAWKEEQDRNLDRLYDLYEKLHGAVEDDMDKATEAVEKFEALMRDLGIKLPPRRSRKKDPEATMKEAKQEGKSALSKFWGWATAPAESTESKSKH